MTATATTHNMGSCNGRMLRSLRDFTTRKRAIPIKINSGEMTSAIEVLRSHSPSMAANISNTNRSRICMVSRVSSAAE